MHYFVFKRADVNSGNIKIRFRGNGLRRPFGGGFSVNGRAAGDLIEPCREDGVGREAVRLTGEVDEHGLGDFLSQLRGADLAEGRGKNEAEIATHDLGESVLGVLPGIPREQLKIGIIHVHKVYRRHRANRTRKIRMGQHLAFYRPTELVPLPNSTFRTYR